MDKEVNGTGNTSVRFIGGITLIILMTLNADVGTDMDLLDAIINYINKQ